MVLVDTTVWIDFLAGHGTAQVLLLEQLLSQEEDICTCGVVLTEVLQGIRTDADYRRTKSRFDAFLYLPMARGDFVRAADLYRKLRRKGITVRKLVDCIIAAVALRHNVPLLHNDRDFDPLARHCGLMVVPPG